MKEKSAEKDFWTELLKKTRKLFRRQQKYMTDNNETTNALLFFLEMQPEFFAGFFGITERDMIKWALRENIKQNQLFIDKIQEVEREYDLPLEYTN